MKIILIIFLSLNSYAQTTILELGQTKIFNGTAKQVWIEKSAIIKADSVGGSIRITAKKVGSSKVRINSKNETIEVLHPDQVALFEKMKQLVANKPGLHAEVEDGEVVIKGYLHDWTIWKSLAKEFNFSTYRMKAELSPLLKLSMQKNFNDDLKSQGLLSVNVIKEPFLDLTIFFTSWLQHEKLL